MQTDSLQRASMPENRLMTPIKDTLTRFGTSLAIDLRTVFDPGFGSFALTNSAGEVVEASIDEDGVLSLDFTALGHADLTITATNAAGETATDKVRFHVAGENAYTLAVIPDTQSYTSTGVPEVRALFGRMTDWLVEQKDSLGIQHVIHVGDITDNNIPSQWEIAEDAMERLDGELPYTLAVGNHDQAPGGSATDFSSLIDDYFTPEQVGAEGTYDGYAQPSLRNSYTTFTAPDGTDWLILSLEFGAPDDVLRWASEVVEGHLDHRVILDTHSWNGGDKRIDPLSEPLTGENGGWGYGIREDPRNVNDGEDIWQELVSKYPNMTFTFNGHNFLDGAETVITDAAGDNPVLQIFANYQNGISGEITGAGDPSLGGRGGNGALRLVILDPENDRVVTHTKFVGLDTYFERVDHQEVFGNVDLGTPERITIADAGETEVVPADGVEAIVALDSSGSNEAPGETTYRWYDAAGELLGRTTGAPLETSLQYGTQRLTLLATDAEGNESRDGKVVIVEAEGALLTDTFDDGDLEGWVQPREAPPQLLEGGTELGFALPSLGGADQIPLTLTFDSHWRPFDNQTGQVLVSFDGGAPVELLRYDSSNTDDTSQRDETVAIDFLAPASASGISVSFRLSGADNDWYWAFDNVALATRDGRALLSENFDALAPALQPAVDENVDALGWTHDGPEGWSREIDRSMPLGTTEWRGWSFVTPAFWTGADGQARGEFTKGEGVIVVADPDEWDDYNGGAGGDTDSFDSTLTTPAADLTAVGGGAPEGEAAGVVRVAALDGSEGVLVRPTAGGMFDEYTLIYDIYVTDGAFEFASLLQTDPANRDDAEIYLLNNGDGTASVGTLGDYAGSVALNGWSRIALSFAREDDAQVLRKYVNGALAGTQTVDGDLSDGSRWRIDADTGFLLLSEPNGFTSEAFLNAFAFTGDKLSDEAIAALGGVDLDGPLAASPDDAAFQFNFDGPVEALDFGEASIESVVIGAGDSSYLVKGSIFGNPDGEGEAALYQQSDGANEILVWGGEDAAGWSDYVYDLTIRPSDNDTVGAVFYFQDSRNHYALTLDTELNERVLTRVRDGVVTELAREAGGYRHNADATLSIAAVGGEITVTLDEDLLFDGPVTDAEPLPGGSVGVLSRSMNRVAFDNISVNPAGLRAKALAATPGALTGADLDGDGVEAVTLTAAASIGSDTSGFEWLIDGEVVATGESATIDVGAGETAVTLRVTGAAGAISEDMVTTRIAGQEAVLAAEDFAGDELPSVWTIVDQGSDDAPSDWAVVDGALVQRSDIGSEQQETGFGAWSLGGEGAHILRRGTIALYDEPDAFSWTDYAVEATVSSADNDGLGLVFRYVDEGNYYKLELDDETGTIQLTRLENGYETVLARAWAGYDAGQEMRWRVTAQGDRLSAEIDGVEVFSAQVDDKTHAAGTVGLYSWNSEGVSFDDVTVVRLGPDGEEIVGTPGDDVLRGTDGDDRIDGRAGDDRIEGGAGNDVLIGGEGRDILIGGEGSDLFVFASAGGRRDRVVDLGSDDFIVTTAAIFDGNGDEIITYGRNRAFDLMNGDAFTVADSSGRMVSRIEFDGAFERDGATYYLYSLVGSTTDAGTALDYL